MHSGKVPEVLNDGWFLERIVREHHEEIAEHVYTYYVRMAERCAYAIWLDTIVLASLSERVGEELEAVEEYDPETEGVAVWQPREEDQAYTSTFPLPDRLQDEGVLKGFARKIGLIGPVPSVAEPQVGGPTGLKLD